MSTLARTTPPLRRVLASALRAPFRVAHGCVRTADGLRVEILPEPEEPADAGLVTLRVGLCPLMSAPDEAPLTAAVERKVLRPILRDLAKADPATRRNACHSLAALGSDAAAKTLRTTASHDPAPAVRAEAKYALQKLRLPRYAPEALAGQLIALEFNARPATYVTATTDARGCAEFAHVPARLTCRLRWQGTTRFRPGALETLRAMLEQGRAQQIAATHGTTRSVTNASGKS